MLPFSYSQYLGFRRGTLIRIAAYLNDPTSHLLRPQGVQPEVRVMSLPQYSIDIMLRSEPSLAFALAQPEEA